MNGNLKALEFLRSQVCYRVCETHDVDEEREPFAAGRLWGCVGCWRTALPQHPESCDLRIAHSVSQTRIAFSAATLAFVSSMVCSTK